METHLNITDNDFENQFATCELKPSLFSHEAHLRLAWIHISKYGEEQAIKNICSQLWAFVNHAGAIDKYNRTLTIAAIKAVNHFINKQALDSFQEFITTYPRLKYNFKELNGMPLSSRYL